MKKRNVLRIVLIILLLSVMLYAARQLVEIWREYAQGTETYDELAEQYITVVTEPPKATETPGSSSQPVPSAAAPEPEQAPITVSFDALLQECGDVVGWIYCEDTPINYPIVQSDDNSYYLYRLMSGEHNSSGTLFMDHHNQPDFSDWNTVIYGHNMRNDSMFGILPEYMKQNFYDAHPVMYLLTPAKNYRIELVCGFVTPADSEVYAAPASGEERDELLRNAMAEASFDADVEILEEDRLITLSTCVYDYENARYVLIGVLRELGAADLSLTE